MDGRNGTACPSGKTYGEGFAPGFAKFKASKDFADVKVVISQGEVWLHSLLLANRSEFFHRALAGGFTESRTKIIELHLDKLAEVWPMLVDYFYTDLITVTEDNVLAVMALSRQLLVASVDGYCCNFINERLNVSNCISYLRQAVKYNIDNVQKDCIALAAKGACSHQCLDLKIKVLTLLSRQFKVHDCRCCHAAANW